MQVTARGVDRPGSQAPRRPAPRADHESRTANRAMPGVAGTGAVLRPSGIVVAAGRQVAG